MEALYFQQTEDMEEGTRGGCGDRAVNNDYRSYIVDLSLEGDTLDSFDDYCIFPLGYNQAIIYRREEGEFTGSEPEIRYSRIPKCYGLMSTQELEAIGVTRVQRFPQLALRGQGTLVAVIDTGVDLTNPLFLYEDNTTKVLSFWDQTVQSTRPPEGFGFGTEWTQEEIDRALAGENEMAEGEMRLPRDEEGHGTFMAAVAAGREREEGGFSGVAPDASLLVVKLKQAKPYLRNFYSIDDGIWACQEDDVMMAVSYVIRQARSLGRPVSVVLGIGTNMGGHSGTTDLERYISGFSLISGVSFHIAAGNEGLSGHHYRGRILEREEYETVHFHVAQGESGFIMELWGRYPDVFTVSLISPGGESVEKLQLKLNEFRRIRFFPEETVLEIRSFPGEIVSGDQVICMNFRRPAAGTWTLRVYAAGIGTETLTGGYVREFNLWLPIGNFIKNDTFFLNADPNDTVTSPGNAEYSITYAPFDVTNDSLYVRSSRGFTRDGRVKPDLAAPGVGVEIPSSRPGGRPIVKSGSSVAAAFGAGIGTLMQEWALVRGNEPSFNGQSMRFYLIQGASRPGAYEYPNREWGYGIVNVYDAFLVMRQ